MTNGGLEQGVKDYQRLWQEAGVELSASWTRAQRRVAGQVPSLTALEEVRAWVGDCTQCRLSTTRTNLVFGLGNPKAKLLFIGEGPGADEDASGTPFAGPAGELLAKIIEAMGLDREKDTYLTNIVKCRPPGDRPPEADEVSQCSPFLKEQIRLISPRLIVALGSAAAATLLSTDQRLTSLRGKLHPLAWAPEILVMPTFHPAYLLRNPIAKKDVWEDMKRVMQDLGAKVQ